MPNKNVKFDFLILNLLLWKPRLNSELIAISHPHGRPDPRDLLSLRVVAVMRSVHQSENHFRSLAVNSIRKAPTMPPHWEEFSGPWERFSSPLRMSLIDYSG
jgi:hypothetical protein